MTLGATVSPIAGASSATLQLESEARCVQQLIPLADAVAAHHSPLHSALIQHENQQDQRSAANRLLGPALYEPLTEFTGRPSKQFRGRMVETGYRLAGGKGRLPEDLVVVVEALHSGSLIIDDIEDASRERRGGSALHVKHGMPVALNAGNWLYFWALSRISAGALSAQTELALYRLTTSTLLHCHEGQALDVHAKVNELEQSQIPQVAEATTRLKTGQLMQLSALMGATVAGASESKLEAIGNFACELGVTLQMLDDQSSILSPSRAQKAAEDLQAGRCTWPWAWIAERLDQPSFRQLQRLAERVMAGTEPAEKLRAALSAAMDDSMRAIAPQRLRRSFAELRRELGASDALRSLTHEIARLEKSYV